MIKTILLTNTLMFIDDIIIMLICPDKLTNTINKFIIKTTELVTEENNVSTNRVYAIKHLNNIIFSRHLKVPNCAYLSGV